MTIENQREQHLLNVIKTADRIARRLGERFIPNEHVADHDGVYVRTKESLPLNR